MQMKLNILLVVQRGNVDKLRMCSEHPHLVSMLGILSTRELGVFLFTITFILDSIFQCCRMCYY